MKPAKSPACARSRLRQQVDRHVASTFWRTPLPWMINLGMLCLALGGFCALAASEPHVKPPNILWILAEDIGLDLGCYGEPVARTPNLDRLAAEGRIYRHAYSTAPVCSSSRSAFTAGMRQTSIDVTAATLFVAGVPVPSQMHGRAFLGPEVRPRELLFTARDRIEETGDQGAIPEDPAIREAELQSYEEAVKKLEERWKR